MGKGGPHLSVKAFFWCCLNAAARASVTDRSPSHKCCGSQTLALGVIPVHHPPMLFLNEERSHVTGGFVPELLEMLGDELGASASVSVSEIGSTPSIQGPTAVACLDDGSCNVAVVDLGAFDNFNQPNRSKYIYTAPFLQTHTSVVVPIRVRSAGRVWALMDPLGESLWLALGLIVMGSAALMVLLTAIRGDMPLRRAMLTWGDTLYHILAFLLSGK